MISGDTSLGQRIAACTVEPGTVACAWLGQAGYLFKSPAGLTILIDPYFSDYGEDQWGLKRVVPPPIDYRTFRPDLLLSSHWHEDHLDAPVIKHYAHVPDITLIGPNACVLRAAAWGWPAGRLVELNMGDQYEIENLTITTTFARHHVPHAPAPDAVGFLLDLDGVRIWDVADTEYDARLRSMRDAQIDVMFVPINGVGGNMNANEAALLAWHVQPRVAIPMHYNMWAPEGFGPGATLDPGAFADTYSRLGGTGEVRILEVGEIVTLPAIPSDPLNLPF